MFNKFFGFQKNFKKKKSLQHTQKIIYVVLSGKIRDKGFLLILLFSSEQRKTSLL